MRLTPKNGNQAEPYPSINPDDISHLLIWTSDLCWWCQEQPATTGEHKFKRTDLTAFYDRYGTLFHADTTNQRFVPFKGHGALRRDRHGLVKFEKSMCVQCNGARSQPFDRAYDTYSAAVRAHPRRYRRIVDLHALYGEDRQPQALNLARYFVKHFCCRLIRTRIAVPPEMRAFLDGATSLPDVNLNFIRNDSIRWVKTGYTLSADSVMPSDDLTRIRQVVMASYLGQIGVRFCWIPGMGDTSGYQFFSYPAPTVHRFANERAVEMGPVSAPTLTTRLLTKYERRNG